jgi:phenylalanyl-tRNA synthetase alpha chain
MEVISSLESLVQELKKGLDQASLLEELENLRVDFLGRKGRLAKLMSFIPKLDPADRPKAGQLANNVKGRITELIDARLKSLEDAREQEALKRFDATLPGRAPWQGSIHPISLAMEEICSVFRGLGFDIESGPEIETDYYNFEALNLPPDHPARDMQDTFYISDKVVLRTQTSGVQIHTMESQKPPIYMICPGTVYRPDTADACHLPQFNQIEGLVVDEGITFGDLKGTLDYFVKCMFGEDRKTRYRPHFFPFTEPSCEVDVSCHVCGGKGCNFCKHSGWIEILGCGMVDPNVLINCGIDPEKYTGFAFGIGAERVAALRYDLPDLRTLMTGDMRFLNQF